MNWQLTVHCTSVFACLSLFFLSCNTDRYVLVGSRHGSWHEGSSEDWSSGAAIMTQLISSMMSQARLGWQPDRTIIFTSWGGSALGSIGSFEWGEVKREKSNPPPLLIWVCASWLGGLCIMPQWNCSFRISRSICKYHRETALLYVFLPAGEPMSLMRGHKCLSTCFVYIARQKKTFVY